MIPSAHPAGSEVARVEAILAAQLGGFPIAHRDLAVRCVKAVEHAVIDRAIADMERVTNEGPNA